MDENKWVVGKKGENDVCLVERRNLEKGSSTSTTNCITTVKSPSGLSKSRSESEREVKKIGENGVGLLERRVFEKDSRKMREISSEVSPRISKGKTRVKTLNNEVGKISGNGVDNDIAENGIGLVERRSVGKGTRKRREIGHRVSPRSRNSKDDFFVKTGKKPKKGEGVHNEKTKKVDKKITIESPELMFRVGLDMCSKNGDVIGALKLYDKAQKEGIKLGQYHYSVLLYLCSSAAIGVISPAKSGKSSRSLSTSEASTLNSIVSNEIGEISSDCDLSRIESDSNQQNKEIRVSDDMRNYSLKRGFEIYERMRLEKVPLNEASLTSIARMALAMGDGDMAFDTVKQMKELGINPRLRSYGPSLSAFCNCGNTDKAFSVEKHMLEHGVNPEEPELEALLRVSVEGNRSDKVYYLLHKLRTSVRQVSPSVADLLEKWFKSDAASKVGKVKWDVKEIRKMIEKKGGGWHGEGWFGKGKWIVSKTSVGEDGICKSCGEKLATIDLDPMETEKFAESVASIAAKREKNSSFQHFQKWLDYYGPFEAVVDAANIGLFSQRKFKPSKVNAVVNGIRHILPSKKWPLIVLHNRRVTDDNMDKPMNKSILEKWKNADALYATPTGSNDDWYWLYAAIKFKCLLVTNDEMRDHLFQLLGNDFFPRWKERHQVHFSFSEVGPEFHMPPPCSVVIQESEKGHWHIPIASEHEFTEEREWLCVARDNSLEKLKTAAIRGESDTSDNEATKSLPQENSRNPTNTSATIVSSRFSTILRDIKAAEKLGGCVVDFEI